MIKIVTSLSYKHRLEYGAPTPLLLFSQIEPWLTELLRKDRKFSWNDAAQRSYIDLKSRLASRPILRAPDYRKEFGLAVDASQTGLAACLFQVDNEMEHPVCYISRKLRVHEKNYSTIEK